MTDRSLKIIYALKQSDKSWEWVITEYRTKELNNPNHIATGLELYDIIRDVFVDYISTCDHPEFVVNDLLGRINNNGSLGMAHHMAILLKLQQVRERDDDGNYYFVNGFRSLMEEET